MQPFPGDCKVPPANQDIESPYTPFRAPRPRRLAGEGEAG